MCDADEHLVEGAMIRLSNEHCCLVPQREGKEMKRYEEGTAAIVATADATIALLQASSVCWPTSLSTRPVQP